MRTPSTVNNNHLSSHQLNQFNFNEYSVTELQELTRIQQEQIKQNQQLLRMREQRLKSLEQQQNNYENQQLKMFKQEETKSIRLKNLQNQLNTQATFGNQLELLKQIYLNKEQELNNSLSKLDESTKQLDQIRKLKLIVNNDQKEDKNQLEKLKQELMIRTNLNEQQSRQIIYQRQIFAAKQNELNQLDQRIEQLQQTNKSSKANDFRSALNSVQDTLNKINIAQIEKQMLQLAKSFDSIPTKKVNNSSKIAFASKSEIAATYMTQPVMSNQQSLPAKLRLNDDILSVHYNNITSNIKKRHSISDLIEQPVDIQVRDDTIVVEQAKEIFIEHPQLLNVSEDEDDDDDEEPKTIMESYVSDTESEGSVSDDIHSVVSFSTALPLPNLKSLLKTATTPRNTSRRVVFNPLALLLDAAVLGELDLLIKSAKEVKNPSEPNDEGLTALHNAVCSSNFECIQFLVEFGCNINYADNDGWTPLHCAASCNSISIVKFLIEHGACVYATTFRDNETAADKCEEEEDDYASCYEYLRNIENDLGVINDGLVYGLYDYESDCQTNDELEFKTNDQLIILRRGDETECQWWWARHQTANKEGYVPRNYLGLYPRVKNNSNVLTDK